MALEANNRKTACFFAVAKLLYSFLLKNYLILELSEGLLIRGLSLLPRTHVVRSVWDIIVQTSSFEICEEKNVSICKNQPCRV